MAFVTDESVLFIEVSSIQRCPYREIPLYIYILHFSTVLDMIGFTSKFREEIVEILCMPALN